MYDESSIDHTISEKCISNSPRTSSVRMKPDSEIELDVFPSSQFKFKRTLFSSSESDKSKLNGVLHCPRVSPLRKKAKCRPESPIEISDGSSDEDKKPLYTKEDMAKARVKYRKLIDRMEVAKKISRTKLKSPSKAMIQYSIKEMLSPNRDRNCNTSCNKQLINIIPSPTSKLSAHPSNSLVNDTDKDNHARCITTPSKLKTERQLTIQESLVKSSSKLSKCNDKLQDISNVNYHIKNETNANGEILSVVEIYDSSSEEDDSELEIISNSSSDSELSCHSPLLPSYKSMMQITPSSSTLELTSNDNFAWDALGSDDSMNAVMEAMDIDMECRTGSMPMLSSSADPEPSVEESQNLRHFAAEPQDMTCLTSKATNQIINDDQSDPLNQYLQLPSTCKVNIKMSSAMKSYMEVNKTKLSLMPHLMSSNATKSHYQHTSFTSKEDNALYGLAEEYCTHEYLKYVAFLISTGRRPSSGTIVYLFKILVSPSSNMDWHTSACILKEIVNSKFIDWQNIPHDWTLFVIFLENVLRTLRKSECHMVILELLIELLEMDLKCHQRAIRRSIVWHYFNLCLFKMKRLKEICDLVQVYVHNMNERFASNVIKILHRLIAMVFMTTSERQCSLDSFACELFLDWRIFLRQNPRLQLTFLEATVIPRMQLLLAIDAFEDLFSINASRWRNGSDLCKIIHVFFPVNPLQECKIKSLLCENQLIIEHYITLLSIMLKAYFEDRRIYNCVKISFLANWSSTTTSQPDSKWTKLSEGEMTILLDWEKHIQSLQTSLSKHNKFTFHSLLLLSLIAKQGCLFLKSYLEKT